jgi:dTDP-4-amino-4,6-dideoxygalactose transaminase
MTRIPQNSTCLALPDYLPYFRSAFTSIGNPLCDEVWGPLLDRRRVIPTPTGRHALWYFLETTALEPGDEVLIASYNFYVIVRLVIQRGLVPVFVDIDPETLCLDPADLEASVGPRSRLVIATHMFGNSADLDTIEAVCHRHDLLLFEDCAHAVGTLGSARQVGQSGAGALFSFGVEKLVNSFGGGMLALADERTVEPRDTRHEVRRLESFLETFSRFAVTVLATPRLYGGLLAPLERLSAWLAEHGRPGLRQVLDPSADDPDYRFAVDARAPFKAFMTGMHRMQLDRLEANIGRRRDIIARIKDRLVELDDVRLLDEDKHGRANGSYFGIRVPAPLAVAAFLQRRGIASGPHEFLDCASLEQFAEFAADTPASRDAADHVLRLPSYPWLTDSQADRIAQAVQRFFA